MKRLDTESGRRFSYQSSISELEEYYQKQYDLIKKGNTDLATLELVMLGNALDFISFVQTSFGIKLGNGENSAAAYDEVMDALSRGIVNKNLFDKENNIAKKAGAYLGFLIIANIGGEWKDTDSGSAVIIEGREIYVLDFAEKRLVTGTDLNAADYFKKVKTLKQN
ncbi:MAG: hypothetical protein IJ192_00270 [Clostridia bacterium]|nr:hypothetical protein [Clostridia bacterium]MBR2176370.1 hypothetical protein [Clostridia bacterium]